MSLRDAEARRIAATTFDRNVVVTAGAGTGKTSLLVERVLNAIGSDTLELRELAAITFTKKAAAEMRERLAFGLERLIERARTPGDDDGNGEADRSFVWLRDTCGIEPVRIGARALQALHQLHAAQIDTIHAFCSGLLRRYPLQSGVDPRFEVDQGAHWEVVLAESWDRFAGRELGPTAPRGELWRRLLGPLDLDLLRRLAFRLAGFDVPGSLLSADAVRPERREILGDEIAALAAQLDDALIRFGTQDRLKGIRLLRGLRNALAAWEEDGSDGLRRVVDADPDLPDGMEGSFAISGKALGSQLAALKRLGQEGYRLAKGLYRGDDALLDAAIEAVGPFAAEAREAYLERGFVSFDALLVLARNLLRDHPDIRRRCRERFRMLLVDEFQDTDPLQYEIMMYLGEQDDAAATDAFETQLAPGRLFVVGDPKQSIYRFRGADYEAFAHTVDHLLEQEPPGIACLLTENFRSVDGVLDPVNRLFEDPRGVWQASAYQPDYEAIHAARPSAGDGPRVEIWTPETDRKLLAGERRLAESRILAEQIEGWVAAGECRYGDVTVLLRAFSQLGIYLRGLRERGIPFVVDGGREFLRRPEITQLIALLRTLSRPGDGVALLAYLRSPAGGVADTELHAHVAAHGRFHPGATVDLTRCPDLYRAMRRLEELREAIRDLPADQVVRTALDQSGSLLLGAASFEGAQRVANLQKLEAAAAELARDGKLSLDEVIDALEEERSADIEADSPLADEGSQAVRVLTIHKAKGLENARIVVPDLARPMPAMEGPLQVAISRLKNSRQTLAIKIEHRENSAWTLERVREKRHEQAEDARILYVALTRARERLVLFGGKDSDRNALAALRVWDYDSALEEGVLLAGDRVIHRRYPARAERRRGGEREARDVDAAVRRYEQAAVRLDALARPAFRRPSGHEPDGHGRDASPSPRKIPANVIGTVVHRALELWGAEDKAELLQLGLQLSRSVAAQEALDAEALQQEVLALLRHFHETEPGERLRAARIVGREVPLIHRGEDDELWSGTIDLLYELDGTLVVADYKTDAEPDVELLRDRYGRQLKVYAEAVRAARGLERRPRTELWLIRHGKILEA